MMARGIAVLPGSDIDGEGDVSSFGFSELERLLIGCPRCALQCTPTVYLLVL
jgi:hypothetical protein